MPRTGFLSHTPTPFCSVITDPDLNNYFDNSIGSLAPGSSQLVTIQSSITSDIVNTAKTTGQPGSLEGGLYDVSPVEDTDPSEVKVVVNGDVRFADKTPFAPPSTDPEGCIQDNFGNDMLVCAERKVFLESVHADAADSCLADGIATITISLEGSIEVASSVNDLGWYVATDGGDAMTGSCVINGLQEGNTYDFEAGSTVWTEGGGDGDECGDVIVDGGQGSSVMTPIVVDLTVVCADDNEDGTLDFALCFTWSGDSNGDCTITSNTPTESSGSCYCTRYEVPNVDVLLPDRDATTVC